MTLGHQIRCLREAQGLTLDELAARAGTSHSYLSQFERNLTPRPSGEFVAALADVLGVDVDVLLRRAFGHAEPNPALLEFAASAGLTSDEVAILAPQRYRGRQPATVAAWAFLWSAIRLVCAGKTE